jgi:transcription elongation factor Elf1
LKTPDICPFCGSEKVSASEAEFLSTKAWRNIICLSCSEEWTEEFTITKVERKEKL